MRVEVSREDIALGVKGSQLECPVARAMYRASKGHWHVASSEHAFRYARADPESPIVEVAALPVEAQRFVYAFDISAPVKPFAFDVDPVKVPA